MKGTPAITAGVPVAAITVPAAPDSPPMSAADARHLTDRIQADLARCLDGLTAARDGLTAAWVNRAWVALGYQDWDAYCRAELGQWRIKLSVADRRDWVASLRLVGMSERAIASAADVSQATVHRDLWSGDSFGSPDDAQPRTSTGTDGKQYPAQSAAVRLAEQVLDR